MYTEVRWALVAIAALAAALSGWFAAGSIQANLVALRSWQPAAGVLDGAGPSGTMGLRLGEEPNERRVVALVQHYRGLSRNVTVYVDPANPERVRIGGLLQLWLWPATAALLCALGCVGMWAAARAGRGAAVRSGTGLAWSFAPQPAMQAGAIVVHRPKSEGVAPLYWSALGAAALAAGLFAPSGTPFQRLWPILLGSFFMLGTWGLALHNRTFRVAATESGLRQTSALGWRETAWSSVRSVELREVVSVANRAFDMRDRLAFPGSKVRSIVFANQYGFALLRMSENMEPRAEVQRLMDLCERQTGLRLVTRHINTAPF